MLERVDPAPEEIRFAAVVLRADEPAGGLNMRETEVLGELIQKICQKGATVVLVEHDMNLVMDISDQILVLHYGQYLAAGNPRQIKNNQAVIEAYLGRGSTTQSCAAA